MDDLSDLTFKTIEEATDIQDGDYILTIRDGVIKKVEKANADIGGGGSETFVVTFTYDADAKEITGADKTFEDIIDAVKEGKNVIGVLSGNIIRMCNTKLIFNLNSLYLYGDSDYEYTELEFFSISLIGAKHMFRIFMFSGAIGYDPELSLSIYKFDLTQEK